MLASSVENNNLNFKSTPVHYVNLKRVEGGLTQAVFSKLNPNNSVDKKALSYVLRTWEDSPIIEDIYTNFTNYTNTSNSEYYAIELPGNESLGKRIAGLAHIIKKQDCDSDKMFQKLEISEIAVNPKFKHNRLTSPYKNIGEVILGTIFNIAQQSKVAFVEFSSICDDFYNRTFKDARVTCKRRLEGSRYYAGHRVKRFKILSEKFEKYIAYCRKEFGIDFSEKIKN